MARTHGRIYSSMWDDSSDCREMTREGHGMWSFLLSQSDLNQAGLLALRLRRWSRTAKGETPADTERILRELEAARFIAIDWEKEEVLIRTFIRNDRVYRQPNVMLAAKSDARQIQSPRLRAVLVQELARIPLEELPDTLTGKAIKSPRQIVAEAIQDIIDYCGDDLPDPWGTPPEPLPDPPRMLNARVSPSPSPSPSPSVIAAAPPTQPRPDDDESEGQRVNRLARTYTDVEDMSNFQGVRAVVQKAVRSEVNGRLRYTDDDITRGLRVLIHERRAVSAASLRIAIEGPPLATPAARVSTTDSRVEAGLAIVRELQAEQEHLAIGDAS